MTRLELLERVNELNARDREYKYWTVAVLYNTVIYRCPNFGHDLAMMHEVIEGVPE